MSTLPQRWIEIDAALVDLAPDKAAYLEQVVQEESKAYHWPPGYVVDTAAWSGPIMVTSILEVPEVIRTPYPVYHCLLTAKRVA